jgi:hypothetical protein
MRSSLTTAAALSVACAFVAMPAAARPYLILSADDQGFQALDMGNVKRTPEGPDPSDRSIVNHRPPPPPPPRARSLRASAEDAAAEDKVIAEDKVRADDKVRTDDAVRAREDQKFVSDQVRAGRLPDDRIAPTARAEADAAPEFIPATVEVTLIDGFLAGSAYGDKVAPLVERRVEVDCAEDRWRTLSSTFVDAHEVVLASGTRGEDWRPFGGSVMGPVVQAAACKREYRQAAVSRYLNIGEVLANYQAAHGAGVPQPQTREQLLAQRYKNSH